MVGREETKRDGQDDGKVIKSKRNMTDCKATKPTKSANSLFPDSNCILTALTVKTTLNDMRCSNSFFLPGLVGDLCRTPVICKKIS